MKSSPSLTEVKQKKVYETPNVEDYGTIQELTLGGGIIPGDAALTLIAPGNTS